MTMQATGPAMSVTVHCPAKTNLTLRVGKARDEWGGRHELDTVYCGVGLYDVVTVTAKRPGSGFSLDLEGRHLGDLRDDETDLRRNHAVKALFTLAQASGREPDVAIHLLKRIPVAAGLGGGSSDAAGTLLALNRLWDLNWGIERLRPLAATLGADMPFCLKGGVARGTGYGEAISDIEPPYPGIDATMMGQVLIGAYHAPLSTPEVYRTFDRIGSERGDANMLQKAAVTLHPRSGEAIGHALRAGATTAFVSGSGPSVIACVPDDATADAVARTWTARRCVDRYYRAAMPATPVIEQSAAI